MHEGGRGGREAHLGGGGGALGSTLSLSTCCSFANGYIFARLTTEAMRTSLSTSKSRAESYLYAASTTVGSGSAVQSFVSYYNRTAAVPYNRTAGPTSMLLRLRLTLERCSTEARITTGYMKLEHALEVGLYVFSGTSVCLRRRACSVVYLH